MHKLSPSSVEELIYHSALGWPDNIALASADEFITYRELASKCEHLKKVLHSHNIGSGTRVGLYAERSVHSVVSMLAIMSSGAAVVMLPYYNQSSDILLESIVSADIHLLVTLQSASVPQYEGDHLNVSPLLENDHIIDPTISHCILPADPAYMVFTSGSSGKPKAVVVTNSNLLHYISGLISKLNMPLGRQIIFGHLTTLSADLGYTAIFPTITLGGQVYLLKDSEVRDPALFWQSIQTVGINYIKTTPSHFQALIEGRPADAPTFDTVILGGEKFPRQLAFKILTDSISHRVVNHYGPTETTIGAACYILNTVDDVPANSNSVPIGSAIGNTSLSLVDENDKIGELLIGGDGVSAGYYNYGGSHENFITLTDNVRQYKTGDICKELSPGVFEFIKRDDRRIKIQGYLVDPAAIEAIIEEHFPIKAALVDVEYNGNKKLAAVLFIGLETRKDIIDAVSILLEKKFPFYSLPSWTFQMADAPLTPNGKVDYLSLRQDVSRFILKRNQSNSNIPGSLPDDELVTKITAVWEEYSGIPHMSLSTTFKETGADSILTMRFVARLRRDGLNVTIQDVYDHPTPEKLIIAIMQKSTRPTYDGSLALSPYNVKILSPAQESFFELPIENFNHWNQAVILTSRKELNITAFVKAIHHIVKRNDILLQCFINKKPGPISDSAINRVIGITQLPGNKEDSEYVIKQTAEKLQKSICIAEGEIFKTQLFLSQDGSDSKILLIIHHLVIDGISWRIILEELATCYLLACNDKELPLHRLTDFWLWTAQKTPKQQSVIADPLQRFGLPLKTNSQPDNNRSYASWILTYNEVQTKKIQELSQDFEQLEAFLLQSFADGAGSVFSVNTLTIDIERHGRSGILTSEDFLSSIGWFTAVFSLNLCADNEKNYINRSQQSKTNLKTALQKLPGEKTADLCFNFLGTFHFPLIPGVDWEPSHEYIGPCRCEKGGPDYYITFTTRITEGKLIIDILYHTSYISSQVVREIADIVTQRMNIILQEQGIVTTPSIDEKKDSSAGMLMLLTKKDKRLDFGVKSEPRIALLTGATGFLGAHLLIRLIETGNYKIKCIVRGENDDEARQRLALKCTAYFGSNQANEIMRRTEVYAGDISKVQLGLSSVCISHVHDVFHSAADTRLLAPYDELNNTNVNGLNNLLGWMQQHGNPDLHYVSTLAVSGKNPKEECYKFTEYDFRIGQEFLSPYERSKFEAEEIVRNTIPLRNKTHIYRMGHIAAHSVTGVFQQNIGDNRIYQLVKGFIILGMAPRLLNESIAFSHVDTLADSIVAIALNNIPTGTFHIENPYQMKHSELISAIISFGYQVQLMSFSHFMDKIDRVANTGNRVAMLTSMWMQRESRNLIYQQDKTIQLLSNLGVQFPKPTNQWLMQALKFAVDVKFLPHQHNIKSPHFN